MPRYQFAAIYPDTLRYAMLLFPDFEVSSRVCHVLLRFDVFFFHVLFIVFFRYH